MDTNFTDTRIFLINRDSKEFRDFRDARESSSEKTPFVMTPFAGSEPQKRVDVCVPCSCPSLASRAAKWGGFQTGPDLVSNGGVSRSGLVLPFLSFFVLFGTFPIFPGFSRFAWGWSGDFADLSFSSFSVY